MLVLHLVAIVDIASNDYHLLLMLLKYYSLGQLLKCQCNSDTSVSELRLHLSSIHPFTLIIRISELEPQPPA